MRVSREDAEARRTRSKALGFAYFIILLLATRYRFAANSIYAIAVAYQAADLQVC